MSTFAPAPQPPPQRRDGSAEPIPEQAGAAGGWRAYAGRVMVLSAVAAVLLASGTAVAYAWTHHRDNGIETVWGGRLVASPSASIAAPATSKAPTVSMAAVGDVIMGTAPSYLPPRAGAGLFDPVRDALAGDLVMGNLEEPLTDDLGVDKCGSTAAPSPSGSRPASPAPSASKNSGCYQFHLPPSYANVLRSGGFSLVNLANNHTMDEGATGLRNTREALAAAGVQDTGAPGQITVHRTATASVAVIGVAPYPWCQSLLDITRTAELVSRAATQADLVVVQMQAGGEGVDKTHVKPGMELFLGEQRGDPYRFARAMIDAGADLIIGHGPHVMRGMEFYKGRLIAYSLGNFAGYRVLSSTGNSGVGGVLRVTLTRDGGWVSGSLVPTHMVNGGLPAPDSSGRAVALVSGLSAQDFGATAARIAPDGTITPATTG